VVGREVPMLLGATLEKLCNLQPLFPDACVQQQSMWQAHCQGPFLGLLGCHSTPHVPALQQSVQASAADAQAAAAS
jgi:hypothetical protein